MNRLLSVVVVLLLVLTGRTNAFADDVLTMATTTSTDNSGLLSVLNPPFETGNNIQVNVIAVGTGKAIRLAENGDVDLVLVHAPAAEIAFVDSGYGVKRWPVMHNDFIILGPKSDSAGVGNASDAGDALRRISEKNSDFVSRGDDSGTNKKELELWKDANIIPQGSWYISAGQGMGAVLRIADDKNAYTLCDRGTYLALKQKLRLLPLYQGVPELFNPYHAIAVNPDKHPHVQYALAQRYIKFLSGLEGQKIIADFKVDGETLFHPDVNKVLQNEYSR